MKEERAARYRARAERALTDAQGTTDLDEKSALLEIAGRYDCLADLLEIEEEG